MQLFPKERSSASARAREEVGEVGDEGVFQCGEVKIWVLPSWMYWNE